MPVVWALRLVGCSLCCEQSTSESLPLWRRPAGAFSLPSATWCWSDVFRPNRTIADLNSGTTWLHWHYAQCCCCLLTSVAIRVKSSGTHLAVVSLILGCTNSLSEIFAVSKMYASLLASWCLCADLNSCIVAPHSLDITVTSVSWLLSIDIREFIDFLERLPDLLAWLAMLPAPRHLLADSLEKFRSWK